MIMYIAMIIATFIAIQNSDHADAIDWITAVGISIVWFLPLGMLMAEYINKIDKEALGK